ncbi:type I-MYXAN CRISPR-associated endonuclease Cas4/Cas1 [Thiococcus pfennigii]|nr:type I-MYXAN CRISPR-associated endonuclease Cas4/Cas1 [Thiococcus pfennigii]
MQTTEADRPVTRVMALHALAYCERLFYLEEVEEIRVADHRVYAGRTLHADIDPEGEWSSVTLESERWGLKGKIDYVRYRDGAVCPFEHKRGRARGDDAWPSDRLQVIAYAALLADHLERPVPEGRIRYHASNKTVRVAIDTVALGELRAALARAAELRARIDRPPIAENENLCGRCSLAPICLPEEERLLGLDEPNEDAPKPKRLFPPDDERLILHVTDAGSRIGKRGEQILVTPHEGVEQRFPAHDLAAIVLHGAVQISAQLIQYAASRDIAIHWLSAGGTYIGAMAPPGGVQRRLRQYRGLLDQARCESLTRRLASAKVENQLRFLLRSARARNRTEQISEQVDGLKAALRGIERDEGIAAWRGHEGRAGRHYFAALRQLLGPEQTLMAFSGRNRRPPRDPFNAALSFGYSLLYRDVMAAILCVGLDPALGFFHTPRSAAYPLALDLMELFRTTLWDMPLVGSINRRQWAEAHFTIAPQQVWLSAEGRKLAIRLYEERKQEHWRHPVLDYSLSYARAIELEARLLEKEWSGSPGLFARMRVRG